MLIRPPYYNVRECVCVCGLAYLYAEYYLELNILAKKKD